MFSITSPLHELEEEREIVVVGSGYGGAVAASRMARAGRDVCLLERGEEMLPGEYPETPEEAGEQLQFDFPDEHKGRPTGLYDFRVNPDINVLVGCGLGGTSLINANVVIEPTDEVFAGEEWPQPLQDPDGGPMPLREAFERARGMLQPEPYPEDRPVPPKLEALRTSAEAMGADLERPDLAVTFEDRVNAAGVEQIACTDCGDCVSGCNYGSKNTLLMNYLPDAWNHGADIFTGAEVRYLERDGDRWRVHYRPVGRGREAFDAPPSFVRADVVFLAAGSLGSTEILLRSRRRANLPVSGRLGEGFSGNGDALGFAYNTDGEVRSVGHGASEPDSLPPVGPCITGKIDLRDDDELFEGGLLVEDGVLPGPLAAFTPGILDGAASSYGRDTDRGLGDLVREKGREFESMLRGARHGAVDHSQVYLAMGHDSSDGRMELRDDRLRIRWPGVAEAEVFEETDEVLERATSALGGTYVPNPIWANWFDRSLVTVHPLGGCQMGEGPGDGVVDHRGRVFRGDGGEVYDDLLVCDGATVPGSVGANPLLTITALAERSCALLARDRDWDLDLSPAEQSIEPPEERSVGVSFTERMSGWVSTEALDEGFERAREIGEQRRSPCEFIVTIHVDGVFEWADDPGEAVPVEGTVQSPALSPEPMRISQGAFRLLEDAPDSPETRRMRYSLELATVAGETFTLEGVKTLRNDPGLDAWTDTTTLQTTIREGPMEGDGTLRARGILTLELADLIRQLTTLQTHGASDRRERLEAVWTFGRTFAGKLFDLYGGVFGGPEDDDARQFEVDRPPRKRRPLRVGEPEIHPFRTDDGAECLLTRYRGGSRGPVMLSHGLGVSSRIFSTDTIDTNLLEYLYAHDYDVWLLDYRSSIELPVARTSYNADDIARRDYPAAVETIRQVTGVSEIDVVAHCFGATTLMMAMLDGLEGVRSIVASQIATHVEAPPATDVKSGLHVPELLDTLGLETLDADVDPDAPWWEDLYDRALSVYPMDPEDWSPNPVARRVTFLYGQLWELDQLNDTTHDNLGELFGIASTEAFEHLGEMVRAGNIVDAEGRDVYLDDASGLDLPLTLIHGAENACYLPESTEKTFRWLRERNGGRQYARHVIPRYGHIDCIFGKNAADDVYPLIRRHLETYSTEL